MGLQLGDQAWIGSRVDIWMQARRPAASCQAAPNTGLPLSPCSHAPPNSVLWQLFHYVPLNSDGWQRVTEHHTMQMQWQVGAWNPG